MVIGQDGKARVSDGSNCRSENGFYSLGSHACFGLALEVRQCSMEITSPSIYYLHCYSVD